MATPQTNKASLDEIAGTLFNPTTPESAAEVEEIVAEVAEEHAAREIEDPVPQRGDAEEIDDEIVEDEEDATTLEADDASTEPDQEEVTEDVEVDEDGEDKQDLSPEYLDVSDDDLIEVAVDGEVEYHTLRDLKAALSGEGAIRKRLHEATETRNKAHADAQQQVQQLETMRRDLVNTIDQFKGHLLQPRVDPPNEALKQSDPAQYVAHLEAFHADQQRLQRDNATLTQNLQDQVKQRQDNMAKWRRNEQEMLVAKDPEFASTEKLPEIAKQIESVAERYGVSAAELAEIGDHRLFLMAKDMAKFLGLQGKEVPKEKLTKRAPRRLRSGVAQRKTAAKARVAQANKAKQQAATTGKVDDIAAMITTRR